MKSIIACIKREYWEHKNIIIGLPLILSILFILGGIVAVSSIHKQGLGFNKYESQNYQYDSNDALTDPVALTDPIVHANLEQLVDNPHHINEGKIEKVTSKLNDHKFSTKSSPFWLISIFISIAWTACFYYLLFCLYDDRKDNSILFWKSLPVSETQNVLIKLFVGCIGFVAVAIIIGWLTYAVLSLICATTGVCEYIHEHHMGVKNVTTILLWPIVSLVMGAVWAAPVFTYVLMVSAIAKRAPLILLILPLLVLSILEWMFFGTNYLMKFTFQHMPYGVLDIISSNATEFKQYYLVDNGISLLIGLISAAAFTTIAIWYRNNRFEI